jgi:predicted nucleic acid-binding protein
MNFILVDTNIVIRRLRGSIDDKTWSALLSGRAPAISPVTLHEIRRGIRPGSTWESKIDHYPAPMVDPPTESDWITAADLIRKYFWNTHKEQKLACLQNDALIAITAKRLNAELWSKDGDMRILCNALGVKLFVD